MLHLHTKVLFEAFLYLQFGFVTSSHKNIGAKAARKMLIPDCRVQDVNRLHVWTEGPEAGVDCGQAEQGHGRDGFDL